MSQSTNDTPNASINAVTTEPEGDTEAAVDALEDSGVDSDDRDSLPLDVVFDMLKNERRRKVLDYLRTEEGPFTLSELAEHIAALENDKDVAALNSTERKRVYVGLYQCHFPRMADAGVIEFDRDRGTVRTGDNIEQLYPYLDVDGGDDDHLPVYLGLAAVFGIGLLLGVLAPATYLPFVVPVFLLAVGTYATTNRIDRFGT